MEEQGKKRSGESGKTDRKWKVKSRKNKTWKKRKEEDEDAQGGRRTTRTNWKVDEEEKDDKEE